MRGKPNPGCHDARGFRIIPAHAGQTSSPDLNWASTTDHPRACGANFRRSPIARSTAGSSPRMRGKLGPLAGEFAAFRIIPAHAGQTGTIDGERRHSSDHPRACGANATSVMPRSMMAGSSPRMRGKRVQQGHRQSRRRIIPAHAGQTTPAPHRPPAISDHPRACGANPWRKLSAKPQCGSSPRMRGKRRPQQNPAEFVRIIPAHAGQTIYVKNTVFGGSDHPRACGANNVWDGGARRRTDHPRACGANTFLSTVPLMRFGSSPRMRGKPVELGYGIRKSRIIPAHAGQTSIRSRPARTCPDHPRACGANANWIRLSCPPRGSSPRMRGKHVLPYSGTAQGRIIPAHAGQTRIASTEVTYRPDHPRACGANHASHVFGRFNHGSSPRMRGKRRCQSAGRTCGRIIPAHAGQTDSYAHCFFDGSDHPRACGANSTRYNARHMPTGSSPRMRGKRGRNVRVIALRRIIPAHAGQTWRSDCARSHDSDHPRACGANVVFAAEIFYYFGSSPRMRGKLPHGNTAGATYRIIPAHAGQTWP